MADCGYHSPQFSEEIAWLPEWLQPHQLPSFGERAKDELMFSPLECKNSVCFPRNACDGQDGQLFTGGDAKYSGCHLFLSGDDNSPTGSAPSSGNALHLHLHLSSPVGVSQFSSDQLSANIQTTKCEASIGQSTRPMLEASGELDTTSHQTKMDGEKPSSDMSPVVCKPKESHKLPLESHIKVDKANRQGLQEKHDRSNLQSTDVQGAVELSIAASEALVISEILSSSLHSEPLPMATSVLEIALRVKQARNQYYVDILDSDSALPADVLDETHQLSDLDEAIMADAFDDVGLSVTQIVATLDNSISTRRSSHDNGSLSEIRQQNIHFICSCDLIKPILASNVKSRDKAKGKKLRAQVIDTKGSASQRCGPFPIDNINAFAAAHLDIKGGGKIFKDDEVAKHVDTVIAKGTKKYFIEETSFISESMDVANEQTMEQGPVSGAEIIGYSCTPPTDLSRCSNSGNKRSTHEKLVLSQDPEKFISSPIEDSLCSVVPCSISSENAPIYLNVDMGHGGKFMNLTESELQNLDGKTTTPDTNLILPSKTLVPGEKCEFLKVSAERSGISKRKHFNSLKPYSMVVTGQKTGGQTSFPNESMLSNKDNNVVNLFPTEEKINYFMSKKCDLSKMFPNPIEKDVNTDGLHNCHTHGSNDFEKLFGPATGEKVNEPYAIEDTKDDNIEFPVHNHEEKQSPLILNYKARRRLRACKIILCSEGERLERPLAPQKGEHSSRFPTKEARCKDRTDITLNVPPRSSLSSISLDKGSLQNKRLRFSDAKCNSNVDKATGKLQHGYESHGLCYIAHERMKESNMPCMPESRKKRISHVTGCSTMEEKEMIFQGLEFLLTGFSSRKEKELGALIRKHGGFVFSSVPSYWPDVRRRHRVQCARWKLPIILSPKKVQSTKFLYGCAINAWMLNPNWLFDSLQANTILPPGKYMTRLIQTSEKMRIGEPLCLHNYTFIFDRVAVMPCGKAGFCTKFSKIIKHGGGQVFKSMQQLVKSLKNGKNSVGAILVEDEGSNVPRHLKHCALEHNLQTMPASWIINSLFSGKLLPLKKDRCAPLHRIKMPTFPQAEALDMSEEI